jgi:hypothetical protein
MAFHSEVVSKETVEPVVNATGGSHLQITQFRGTSHPNPTLPLVREFYDIL